MSNATRVLQVAAKEVGYSRWDDPLTGTKYGRWYAGLGKGSYYAANGVPYCAMFASWVFAQAGAKCVGLPEAYCPYIVNAAKNAGKWVGRNALKPGDLILFSWAGNGVADHVGIVEKVFSGYVQTIEGNTSSASNANGGLVARRTRSLDYTVLGGVRPAWGTTSTTTTTTTATDFERLIAEMKATHIIFKSKGTVYIADVLAGTYRGMPNTQTLNDTVNILKKAGAKVMYWSQLNASKSDEVANLRAFGKKEIV